MTGLYLLALAMLVVTGFFVGRGRAAVLAGHAGSEPGTMHSLPSYHGLLAAIAALVPMLVIYVIGAPLLQRLLESGALSYFPPELAQDPLKRGAAMRDIQNLAAGQFSGTPSAELMTAAAYYVRSGRAFSWGLLGVGIATAIGAMLFALARISLLFRARIYVERVVLVALMVCAAVAVLTTIGIVLSVAFEAYRFFFDPALKGRPTVPQFLFGTDWNPQAALEPIRVTSRPPSGLYRCSPARC